MNMNLNMPQSYNSLSQEIRVATESWVEVSGYCPNCGHSLEKYPNNQPAADFLCCQCHEDFELKSKQGRFPAKIVDGAYETMLARLTSSHAPNLFLLNYDSLSWEVLNFFVIPKHFFIPDIIEKRKPLSSIARRAGWIGCNILLTGIPKIGRIYFVKDRKIIPKQTVSHSWRKTLFLREEKIESKSWILDIIQCIESIEKREFALADIYKYEPILAKKHPANRHIKDKIRQQLQILRDQNYLDFTGRGEYRYHNK